MEATAHLSQRRLIAGLVCGSLVGLLCYIALQAGSDVLIQFIAHQFFGFEWRDLHIVETVWFVAFFGTPVAIVVGVLVGLPVWNMAEERASRSNRSAMLFGAVAGVLIGMIFLLLGLAVGLGTFLDDRSEYNAWSYGYQITKDGLPTAHGWLIEIKTLLFYWVAGAMGGVVARFVAVPR